MKNSSSLESGSSSASTQSKRERFPIDEEEDREIGEGAQKGIEKSPSIKAIEEKEQAHKHKVEDSKIKIAIGLLIACFGIVVIFSAADAALEIDSLLFSGAFEFAKTIATAIVGYLFAAGSKEK